MYLLSFVIDGESYITIKYIQKADDERYVRLVSHNPHHSPKEIPADSDSSISIGKSKYPIQYNGIVIVFRTVFISTNNKISDYCIDNQYNT